MPSEVTDRQHAGYSKIASISVHDAVVTPSLPPLTAKQIDQWQVDTSDFTHIVNTSISGSSAVQLSHYSFCSSALTSGHLLVDLFGLSKAQCQAAMMHYKLLKLQAPSISAHFVLPAVKHYYSSELFKPEGILMQTCLQFHRARRKAILLYNPPVVQRRDATSQASGLSSVFPVSLAGTPSRALVDTGAEANFVDHSYAQRCGFHITSSPVPPSNPTGQRSNSAKLRSGVSFHANT